MRSSPRKITEMEINNKIVLVPNQFICPITLEILKHPLMTRSGLVFERSAILDWLENGNNTCPLTREPMRLSDLITHRPLKSQIEMWRSANGIPLTDEESEREEEDRFDVVCTIPAHKTLEEKTQHPVSLPTAVRSPRGRGYTLVEQPYSPASQTVSNSLRLPGESRDHFLERMLTELEGML